MLTLRKGTYVWSAIDLSNYNGGETYALKFTLNGGEYDQLWLKSTTINSTPGIVLNASTSDFERTTGIYDTVTNLIRSGCEYIVVSDDQDVDDIFHRGFTASTSRMDDTSSVVGTWMFNTTPTIDQFERTYYNVKFRSGGVEYDQICVYGNMQILETDYGIEYSGNNVSYTMAYAANQEDGTSGWGVDDQYITILEDPDDEVFKTYIRTNAKQIKKLTRLYPTHIIGKDGGKAFRKLSPATEGLVFVYNGDETYSIAQSSTESERPTDSDLVIPSRSPDGDAVTAIYESAFSGNDDIVNVFIPESVIVIGEDAFSHCSNVIKIVVPKSVTTISGYAFYYCKSLVDINIPAGVTTLLGRAFGFCETLTSITIPDSVVSFGTHIFINCSALTNVTLPSNMTRLPNGTFIGCTSLKNVELPAGLLSMGTSVFSGCSALSSIIIPDGITSIETASFHSCTSLISVDIPDGLTSIGNRAFKKCSSLVSIDIPDGVTNIGENAFGYCTSLENIIIPDSVTTLGDSMFDECTSLKSAIIGNNVTSPIGEYMFYGCVALTDVTIGNSVTGIGYEAFANCTSLATITIPSSVTTIDEIAFNGCTSLSTIKFNGTRAQWNAITLGEDWNYGVPATYVTCYDGVVYIENPAITFTVNGTSYKATTGQTWREWASSSDNTAGFSVKSLTISGVSSEYVVVSSSGNTYTVIDGKSDFIRPDETITSGTAYLTTTITATVTTPITFTIDGGTATANSGMTWAQWLESDYNNYPDTDYYFVVRSVMVDGITYDNAVGLSTYVSGMTTYMVVFDANDELVQTTDTIVSGHAYVTANATIG